jgi:RHS repeat-associated protein
MSEITYTYDLLGRLATVNTVKRDGSIVDGNGGAPGAPPESTNYFYDLLGRLDYATLPNEVVEDYSWDRMDRLDVVRHFRSDADNGNLADNVLKSEFDYTYRADGKRTQMVEKFGNMLPLPPGRSGWGEGVVTNRYAWQYDEAGRLISEVLDSSDNALDQTETYIMDLVGNRLRRTIDKPGSAEDATDLYAYDANDRILREDRYLGLFPTDPPSGSSVRSTTYGWTGTQQTSRSVSEGTVVRSSQSFTYGLSGQLERVVSTTLDADGAITGRTRVDYRYNPQGIRFIAVDWNDANLDGTFAAGERTGSVEYLIENANFTGYQQTILETVKNAAGQATKRISYTFGLDEITQTTTLPLPGGGEGWGEGETLTFAHDGKGSVRVLFESAAAIAQVFTYSAYGELLAIHNGSGLLTPHTSPLTAYLYNGEGFDTRTGLYNMRARWYSPTNARWERLDPFAGNPNDPFSFHKYGFVHSNPITGSDPTGMFLSSVSISYAAISGAVVGSVVGGIHAMYSGTNVLLGILKGAVTGTLLGVGLFVGGAATIGYAGWLGSFLISLVAGEASLFVLLTMLQSAELKQKGRPPSPSQARNDYDYARLSLGIYADAYDLKNELFRDGWNKVDGFGGESHFYSYRSRLYRNDQRRELVMVYEGSSPRPSHVGDWANNIQQGIGMIEEPWQYERAKRDASEALHEARRLNYRFTITGHSLGGGLATAAALHTNQRAVTFNGAGLNRIFTNLSNATQLITNYRVKGEILSTLQDAPLVGWPLPNSSAGATYWLRARSNSRINRHTDDILPGMQDFF